jgi:hypothetical protein
VSCIVICVTRYDSTTVVRRITFSTKVNISAEIHKIQYQRVALYFMYLVLLYGFCISVEPDRVIEIFH